MPKAKYNFRASKAARIDLRKQLILDALAKLNDAKGYYKDLTSLAKYVAKEISLVETKESQCRPICYTTLLRKNCAYRVIILEYFIQNKKRFSKANLEKVDFYSFSKDIIESNPSLQAFILNFQMEIQELKSELSFQKDENARLKAHLQRQSNNFNKLPTLTQLESFPKPNDFDKIVTAFRTLVEYIPYIHIDYELEEIVDDSEHQKEIIEKDFLKPFFHAIKGYKPTIERYADEKK